MRAIDGHAQRYRKRGSQRIERDGAEPGGGVARRGGAATFYRVCERRAAMIDRLDLPERGGALVMAARPIA